MIFLLKVKRFKPFSLVFFFFVKLCSKSFNLWVNEYVISIFHYVRHMKEKLIHAYKINGSGGLGNWKSHIILLPSTFDLITMYVVSVWFIQLFFFFLCQTIYSNFMTNHF